MMSQLIERTSRERQWLASSVNTCFGNTVLRRYVANLHGNASCSARLTASFCTCAPYAGGGESYQRSALFYSALRDDTVSLSEENGCHDLYNWSWPGRCYRME